ncbi:MAG TPA: glycosyltransferase family 4 protein [Actinomycetota bacterium]
MKILHIVATGERRGAEVFASDLVAALAGEGMEHRVAVLRPPGPPPGVYDPPAATLPSAGWHLPGVRMDPKTARALRRTVARWRPDVVQSHGGEPLKYALAATAGHRVPVVHRRIGSAPRWILRGARRRAHGFLLRRTARVIAVADAVRRETLAAFGLSPGGVVTIPNGVDPGRTRPRRDRAAVRRSLAIDQDAPVVVTLGALTWEKDPGAHLDILAHLADDQPGLVHLFAGDGPLRVELEARAAREGLDRQARFLGSRSDIGDLLGAADVLLFASRPDGMEGMPASLIEAGMAGLPTVAYGVGGVDEVIVDGETGYVVPHGDTAGLAAAVRKLLADHALRASLGDAARRRCAARFDIAAVAPRYLDVYREVLER